VSPLLSTIAAKNCSRECSEVFLLQQNSVVIRSSRPHRRTPAIRGTAVMEWATPVLLRLEARELQLYPIIGFFGD